MSLPVMPTRILIVGGGGREHALAWKLAAEPGVNLVVVAPGSDAIAAEPRVRCAPGVDALDGPALLDLARREAVELAVIGPEAPLAAGVADALRAGGVTTFGPSKAAARIEASKAFCREVASAAGVRMAEGRAFSTLLEAEAFAHRLAGDGAGVVVKADGRPRGRQGRDGLHDAAEATAALEAIFAGGEPLDGRPLAVVEERLAGPEASVIALCDGTTAVALPAARDHKRLLEDDLGPNTGGMGAYCPLPDLPDGEVEAIVERFHRPVLAELARRGTPFTGALYAGLILTRDGPVLLEFNARFGDPETQVLMPLARRTARAVAPRGGAWRARPRVPPVGMGRPPYPVMPGAAVGIVLALGGIPGAAARRRPGPRSRRGVRRRARLRVGSPAR